MTPAGLAALKAELRLDEGLRLRAYQDQGGVWTIGYGHTGPDVHPGLVWTEAEVEGALTADIERAEHAIFAALPWISSLDDARQDVLVDMAFNLGAYGLERWHHLLAAVRSGDFARAAADMLATQPWARQVGERADRLASWMRTGLPPVPIRQGSTP